jgi:N,N'-diacetyllegionaminate synthase
MSRVFIIAEAGVNHNGNMQTATRMITVAKKCGADAIKFQTFNPSKLSTPYARKASYQKISTSPNESQLDMLAKLAIDGKTHKLLMDHCKAMGIQFLSSPFDIESIDLLCALHLPMLKIPSGEITNLPYLKRIGACNKKLIVSTGMADMNEIAAALDVLTTSGTSRKNITLLHCTTEYPAAYKNVNLRAISTLRNTFKLKTGYSDHTPGIEAAIAAVALGADVIEKHFTLDKKMQGPDHAASLEPDELKSMVRAIRNIEISLGTGVKKPGIREIANAKVVRKSIVAGKEIKMGQKFSEENITTKRPGTGISPMAWESVIGKRAKKQFSRDELIRL